MRPRDAFYLHWVITVFPSYYAAETVCELIELYIAPAALREPVAQPLLYEIDQAALEGFGRLFSGLVMLRTHGTSSPISELEAVQHANSLCYVLGSSDLPPDSLKNALANDPCLL